MGSFPIIFCEVPFQALDGNKSSSHIHKENIVYCSLVLYYRKYFWDYTRVHLERSLWQISDFCHRKGWEDTTHLPNFIWIIYKRELRKTIIIFKKLSIDGLFKILEKYIQWGDFKIALPRVPLKVLIQQPIELWLALP